MSSEESPSGDAVAAYLSFPCTVITTTPTALSQNLLACSWPVVHSPVLALWTSSHAPTTPRLAQACKAPVRVRTKSDQRDRVACYPRPLLDCRPEIAGESYTASSVGSFRKSPIPTVIAAFRLRGNTTAAKSHHPVAPSRKRAQPCRYVFDRKQ
jgi:hypothetical protein